MSQDNIPKNTQTEKPEYAGMILDYLEFHGTQFRNPKEWHPELLYNSKKHNPAIISNDMSNLKMEMTPFGLLVVARYPMGKQNLDAYNKAKESGQKFKIYAREDRKIKIRYDQNVRQAVAAHNRLIGFEHHKVQDCEGELISFDISNGEIIMKVIIRG